MATRDVGTTQRPPSTALLTIDSEDRFASQKEKREAGNNVIAYNRSPYDFTLIKNASLVNGYMTRLAVTEVVFPWVQPNINSNSNAIKYQCIIENGGVQPGLNSYQYIIINTGFYTPHQLADLITAQVTEAFPALGFQMLYGVSGNPRFSYTCGAPDSGNSISFSPVAENANPWAKQLFDLLGFVTTASAIPGNNQFWNAFCGLYSLAQNNRYIDITCALLTGNQGLPDSTSQAVGCDSLCRLYLGDMNNNSTVSDPTDPNFCPPGCSPGVIYRQFSNPKQIAWNAIMPVNGRIAFRVLDDTGSLLNSVPSYTQFPPPVGQVGPQFVDAFPLDAGNWSMSLLVTEN